MFYLVTVDSVDGEWRSDTMLFFLFFSFFTDGGCSQCSNGLDFFDSGSVLAPILKNIYIFRNGDTDSSFFDSLKSKRVELLEKFV